MAQTEKQPREKELHELLSHDLVDLYIGPESTHWVLHEKLLCHRSGFFRNIFYRNNESSKDRHYGLPDEEDGPFKMFVAWLYSGIVPAVKKEGDLNHLLDLYLMGEKWEVRALVVDVLENVRRYYHDTDTWPGLRRVQYIYANTEGQSPMRQLLTQCVARMLVTGDGIPEHWQRALARNGQLGLDVILAVQKWGIEKERVPDAREESVEPIVEEVEMKKEELAEETKSQDREGGERLVNGDGAHEEGEQEEEEEGEEEGEEEVDGEKTLVKQEEQDE